MSFVIQENVPLRDKNWFQTGGSARFFCEPLTSDEFQDALNFAHERKLDIFVLGHGANIVVSDEGFDGLVIHPKKGPVTFKETSDKHALVTAAAGVLMDELIDITHDRQLVGLEDFSHIPGSIGGSVSPAPVA